MSYSEGRHNGSLRKNSPDRVVCATRAIYKEDIVAERKVTVECEVGLHARPAATFVQTAAKAPIDVTVAKAGGTPVNAKSILSVLALDVRQGEMIVIKAEGEGADELLDALAAIASAP